MLVASALEASLSSRDVLMAQPVMLVRINVHNVPLVITATEDKNLPVLLGLSAVLSLSCRRTHVNSALFKTSVTKVQYHQLLAQMDFIAAYLVLNSVLNVKRVFSALKV